MNRNVITRNFSNKSSNNKRTKKIITGVILLVVLIFVGSRMFGGGKNKTDVKRVSSEDGRPKQELKMSYQHEIYNFILRYPQGYEFFENDWKDDEQPGGVIYSLQLGNKAVANIKNDIGKEIVLYVAKVDKSDSLKAPDGMDPKSEKETTINGQKAMMYDDGKVYTVAKGDYEYLLVLGDEAEDGAFSDFQDVVSAFKFIK